LLQIFADVLSSDFVISNYFTDNPHTNMNLYSRFVFNTLLRIVILMSCIVILILLSYYMSPNFADNFTTAEQKLLKHQGLYGQTEHWYLLEVVAVILAFAILLLQCLGCLATFKQAQGRLDTPKKARIIKMGERGLDLFGALFSFICLITAVIRLSGIFRFDPVCGIYECEFRYRLIVVAVLYFVNTILFGGLILISMHRNEYFRIVNTGEHAHLIESHRVVAH